MDFDKQPDRYAEAKRAHAVEIVQKQFSDGLAELCDPHFLAQRYAEFLHRDDPIYVELLQGMQDEPLSKTFVSYWTIAQTLATKSRFWLEDAVAEIITSQVKQFGRNATHVYSQTMLGHGYYEQNVAVAGLGEEKTEHLTGRRPWRPPMKENALTAIDVLVGEQERERVGVEKRGPLIRRRDWDEAENGKASGKDRYYLKQIAAAVGGRAISDVAIQCNLLVIEPDATHGKPSVFAFRFINPKTISSHAQRKQERVNLLRLYAYLVQEKLMRQPDAIHVCVAELLPRHGNSFDKYDYYPDYFSPQTYWTSDQLWNYIGVPFDVVSQAIRNVAKDFRKQLHDSLSFLLPDSKPPLDWGKKQKQKGKKRQGADVAPHADFHGTGLLQAENTIRTFHTIQKALEYTVTTLIPQNHTYIINVVGPKEAAENRAATIQVVAQHMIYEDRNCGLTLSLPFDPSSRESAHLAAFMGSVTRDLCDEYKWDGIPCFALRFGTNVEVAAEAIRLVLAEVYGYTEFDGFNYEVHDEGGIESGATQISDSQGLPG